MRDETIGAFLDSLAARRPAPGGGTTAALHAAQAAALVTMVARYSDGPRYAAHAEMLAGIVAQAELLRAQCAGLMAADAAAFGAVAAAYRMPKGSDAERAVRAEATAAALLGATEPQATVITAGARLAGLAEALLPIANRSVIADVGAAAEAIRAAVATARLNIEVNLAGITDAAVQREHGEAIAAAHRAVATAATVITAAEQVSAAVLAEIVG